MKIAIQANPSRGKEIISLLKSLGGGDTLLDGNRKSYTYYIDENNMIRYDDAPKDYKVYTLEKFEKEFVQHICTNSFRYISHRNSLWLFHNPPTNLPPAPHIQPRILA